MNVQASVPPFHLLQRVSVSDSSSRVIRPATKTDRAVRNLLVPDDVIVCLRDPVTAGLHVESIAEAMHGDDVVGIPRIVFNLVPQPHDMHIDGARVSQRIVTPHLLQQRVSRNDFPAVLDQVAQQTAFPF